MFYQRNLEVILNETGDFIEAKKELAQKLRIENKNELRLGTLCPDQNELYAIAEQKWKEWMLVGCKAVDGRYYYDIMTLAEYNLYTKQMHDFYKDFNLACNLQEASELVLGVINSLNC